MLHHTGDIVRFINPEYVVFSQIASVLFLFLFFIQVPRIWRNSALDLEDHSNCGPWGCNHDDGYNQRLSYKAIISYLLIIIPILTGFFLPAKELDASIAAKRAVFLPGTMLHEHDEVCDDLFEQPHQHSDMVTEQSQQMPERSTIILNSNTFANYLTMITTNPEVYRGRDIQIEGFALKDETQGDNYWVIARFLVTHCVADASVIGVLVRIDDDSKAQIKENSWVKVNGTLEVGSHHQSMVPVVKVRNVEVLRQPKEPYVYPSK